MSLSEQELRALQEIEQSLMAEDPKFGAAVTDNSGFEQRGGSLSLRGVALIFVGLLMLIGGVALAQQSLWFVILSIAGFLVMFGASIWMLRGGSTEKLSFERSSSQRGSRSKSRKDDGVGSRLEENFKRRFEN